MFGAGKTAFGAPASSAFGQSGGTLFGSTTGQTQPTPNLFGQPVMNLGVGTSTFGSPAQTGTIGWGTGADASQASNGTSLAFNPPITTDTIQRGGQSSQVNAKHMCITAMKEYQFKSLEELRLEDYALNRQKGTGIGTAGATSIFGGSSAVKSFQFGASQPSTSTTSIFGQANKPTNTLFGSNNLMFGSSVGSAPTAFGQGTQAQASSVFGTKPMFGASTGQATSLFGSPQPASSGFTFGQTQPAGGLGGTTTNLFGSSTLASTAAKPTLFGSQPATGSVLPFGHTQTSGLFGAAKTTTTPSLFGTPAASLGANPTQASNFTFGNTLKPAGTTNLFGAAAATTSNTLKPGGIFGTPSSSTSFGFGTGLSTTQTSGFGTFGVGTTSTAGGLFGQPAANSLTAKKTFGFGTGLTNPTASSSGVFGFGQPAQTGGLFGTGTGATATSTAPSFGLGAPGAGTGTSLFGTGTTGFGLSHKPLTLGGTTGFGLGATNTGLGGTGTGLGTGFGTGLFGVGGSTSLGLGTSTTSSFGSGLTGLSMQQQQPGALGGSLTGLGINSTEQMAQAVRAQQQVLELVRSMPYGQSPLFRYLNASGSDENKNSTASANNVSGSTTGPGGNTVIPARAVANALAERHKAAGLTVGPGSPSTTGTGTAAVNRNMWLRRPAVTQRLLQIANRNKLFSGFYEDDALLSPSGQESRMRVCRSATLNADGSKLDTSGLGSKHSSGGTSSGFFVRRDEWKRLHLPESVRASILERSASSVNEMSTLAEAAIENDRSDVENEDSLCKDRPSWASGDLSSPVVTSNDSLSSKPIITTTAKTTSLINVTSAKSLVPSAVSTPGTPRVDAPKDADRTPALRLLPSTHSGLGLAQAREALRTGGRDDSVAHEDLDSTWTSPSGGTQVHLNVGRGDATTDRRLNGTLSPDSLSDRSQTSPTQSPSPAGIKLTKHGYYTLPTLKELASMVDEEGRCIVEDFVIGRRHYGHILFPGLTDLTDIDLDAVVHLRRREVVVYPDDEKKPAVGFGLNKRAEVCLESIWPTDKATHEPIKSPERLAVMRFEERLERATRRMDARFIEYRPESGSWVFEVKHFSKYGLQDSDEEDTEPARDCASSGVSRPVCLAAGDRHRGGTEAPTQPHHLSSTLTAKQSSEHSGQQQQQNETPIGHRDETDDRLSTQPPAASKFPVKSQRPMFPTLDRSINFLSPNIADAQSLDSLDKHSTEDYQFREPSAATVFGGTQRLSVSTNVVRQMRQAFFSPARAGARPRRMKSRFGAKHDEDEEEYAEDEEEQEYMDQEDGDRNMIDWMQKRDWSDRYGNVTSSIGLGKRFPSSPVPFYEDEAPYGGKLGADLGTEMDSTRDDKSFLTRSDVDPAVMTTLWTSGRFASGPTPEKFPRTFGIGQSVATKWEEQSPQSKIHDDEEESLYDTTDRSEVIQRTPFRPILYEKPCEGVPLTPAGQHQPPVSADLSLARFPAHLKQVEDGNAASADRIGLSSLYPYKTLNKLLKHVGTHTADTQPFTLSRCHLDAGLWHGHRMRPSWGLFRDCELHTLALVTANTRRTSFVVDLVVPPTAIDLIDETLLNAALRSSTRTTELSDTDKGNSHPRLLHPSMDHCSHWEPIAGLAPLESYAHALQCDLPDTFDQVSPEKTKSTFADTRIAGMRRLIGLCLALWGRHPQEAAASALEREQQQLLDDADLIAQSEQLENGDCNGHLLRSQSRMDPLFSLASVNPAQSVRPEEAEPRSYPAAICSTARKQAVSEWIRTQSLPWLRARLRHLKLWHIVVPQSYSVNSADGTDAEQTGTEFPVPRLSQVSTETLGQGIFACLVSGEPGAACRLALSASMPGLASLIAQSTAGDTVVRRGLQRQLRMWHEMKYDQHIPLIILRIYALLAGRAEFPHPKTGIPAAVLANLDWTRVLGAYMWYLTDYALDLAGVLSAYSRAWHTTNPQSDRAVARPVPPEDRDLDSGDPPQVPCLPTDFPQCDGNTDPRERYAQERSWPRDTAYHLLQLFCKRTHRLERTLDPCGVRRSPSNGNNSTCRTNSATLTDWAPTWMLWRVLIALGYRHFESDSTESRLCSEFAAQLETVGLWEWAVFVWLHEPDQTSRDAAVKSVLARHVSLVPPRGLLYSGQEQLPMGDDPQTTALDAANEVLDQLALAPAPALTKAEQFVVNKLGVPLRWIHEAKAVLARRRFAACNRPVELSHLGSRISPRSRQLSMNARLFALLEASHWLAAGHTEAAHSVCVDYLLPDLVLHTDISASLTTDPGPSWAMCRLGHRLARLLQPFDALPATKLPDRFAHGVGLYMMYSDILCLAELLARLCQNRIPSSDSRVLGELRSSPIEPRHMDDADTVDDDDNGTEAAVQGQLASTLSSLRTQLTAFTEQLQYMLTTNLNAKVVRTEMATVCAYVISAFLIASVTANDDQLTEDNQASALDDLQQQLMAMTKVGLPADYHLREQSNLAEARLSIGVV